MVGDRHHHRDMVLDQDHSDAVTGKQPDQLLEVLDLAMGQTRRGFVQQEHSGPQGQRACYFEPPLMAERKIASLFSAKSESPTNFNSWCAWLKNWLSSRPKRGSRSKVSTSVLR